MGFERHLYMNDAVHGSTNYRTYLNYCFSKTCLMVTDLDLWTVVQNLLYLAADSR